MAVNPRTVLFVVFIFAITTVSIIYEHDLNIKDVLGYVLIAVAVCAALMLVIGTSVYTTLHFKSLFNPDRTSRTTQNNLIASETSSVQSSPVDVATSVTVIELLNRLSQLTDGSIRTLPTYNKAILYTRPVRIVSEQCPVYSTDPLVQPPPEYTTINLVNAPPMYDEIISWQQHQSVNPSTSQCTAINAPLTRY